MIFEGSAEKSRLRSARRDYSPIVIKNIYKHRSSVIQSRTVAKILVTVQNPVSRGVFMLSLHKNPRHACAKLLILQFVCIICNYEGRGPE